MPLPLLCETCGYPLGGMAPTAACPECGRSLADSLPTRRPGVPWQHHPNPVTWATTAAALLRSPTRFFDTLSTRGPNFPDRLYLAVSASGAGLIAAAAALALHPLPALAAVLIGMATAKTVLLFSYVEAAGVWFFSRRRGWRVPPARAERIVAYASIGWLPAAVLLAAASRVSATGLPQTLARQVGAPPDHPLVPWVFSLLALGLAVLAFETLVWSGVRRLKYAN